MLEFDSPAPRLPVREVARAILDHVVDSRVDNSTIVLGIDGPDCSGKSTLSRELASVAPGLVSVIHGDDFLYAGDVLREDQAFGVDTFICDLFDWTAWSSAVHTSLSDAPDLLVVEGVFLGATPFRPIITSMVWLELRSEEVLRRALARDTGILGTAQWVKHHYERQCIPAQRIYKRLIRPEIVSDWVVDTSGGDDDAVIVRRP